MALPDPALRDAARRAYEGGRMRHALAVAWPAFAIVGGSWPFAIDVTWHLVAGVALVVTALGLVWRGGSGGKAVGPALAAGVVPLVLPLVTMRTMCAADSCSMSCFSACLIGGAAAGGWFGVRSGAVRSPSEFLVAGAVIAGLAGSLGCAMVGTAGVVGMLLAFAVVAAPLILTASRA
jgi:hypothetical protein